MTTYPTHVVFDFTDPRWRLALLEAAKRLHLDVLVDGSSAIVRVTVTEPTDAYQLGSLTVAVARELGVRGTAEPAAVRDKPRSTPNATTPH